MLEVEDEGFEEFTRLAKMKRKNTINQKKDEKEEEELDFNLFAMQDFLKNLHPQLMMGNQYPLTTKEKSCGLRKSSQRKKTRFVI